MPYPPGTSAGDPRAPWNESHDHQHEFELLEESPIIEDGAAIFREECIYAEGEYGQGYQCEEARTYRFEYSILESPDGETWNLPTIHEWEDHDLPKKRSEKVITIEQRFHELGPSEKVSFDVDPAPDCGQVTISYKGWKLHYEP